MARVLVLSDIQCPFQHPDTLNFFKGVKKKYKCDTVVCIGDELDNKFLKYLSINDPHSAVEQHELALKFLRKLYRVFPVVKVCHSNHVLERLLKAADSAMIPQFMLKTPREFMEAPPGWEWDENWEIDGVRYEHGHRFGGQKPHVKAVESNFKSTVIGHHPILSVDYFMKGGVQSFGMCVGSMTVNLNDARMGYGMLYTKRYAKEMPLGAGVVLDGEVAIPVPYREGEY